MIEFILILFFVIYFILMVCFGLITYNKNEPEGTNIIRSLVFPIFWKKILLSQTAKL